MDPESDKKLVELLHKDESGLTEADKEFMRARQTYIKDKHKKQFPSVFKVSRKKK